MRIDNSTIVPSVRSRPEFGFPGHGSRHGVAVVGPFEPDATVRPAMTGRARCHAQIAGNEDSANVIGEVVARAAGLPRDDLCHRSASALPNKAANASASGLLHCTI